MAGLIMWPIPVDLEMKMTECKTDEQLPISKLPRGYCWPGDYHFECQWWCLSGESCTWNTREPSGTPVNPSKSNPSKPSTISFWLLRTAKPSYQTKMLHPFWRFFSEQTASLKPVARLLVSPGAYKACWEWVDRCDRRGDFLGAEECS